MSNEKGTVANNSAANNEIPMPVQKNERPAFVKKIGKTTYRVRIHFSAISSETMSDKIKQMLKNEVGQMCDIRFQIKRP